MGVLGISCAGDIWGDRLPRAFAVAIPKGLRNWKIEKLIATVRHGARRNPVSAVNPRDWNEKKARSDRSRPAQVAAAWVDHKGCNGVHVSDAMLRTRAFSVETRPHGSGFPIASRIGPLARDLSTAAPQTSGVRPMSSKMASARLRGERNVVLGERVMLQCRFAAPLPVATIQMAQRGRSLRRLAEQL